METQNETPGWGKAKKPGNGGKRAGSGRKKKIFKLTDEERKVIEEMRVAKVESKA